MTVGLGGTNTHCLSANILRIRICKLVSAYAIVTLVFPSWIGYVPRLTVTVTVVRAPCLNY